MKVCSGCNRELDESEFSKSKSTKDGLQVYCKSCNMEYRQNNKNKIKKYQKQYRQRNEEFFKEYGKKYRGEHRNDILKEKRKYYLKNRDYFLLKSKAYLKENAKYSLFFDKLTIDEQPELASDGVSLTVLCRYCGKRFIPTNGQVRDRIKCLNSCTNGECGMYCDNIECKIACPTFRRIKYAKNFNKHTNREVPEILRKIVLERDNFTCQKCGKIMDSSQLQCHHIIPVAECSMLQADPENCMTVCIECHKKIHTEIAGCEYNNIGRE